jgi:hypothetical protein
MKKVWALLVIGFLIISACMAYLAIGGVSMRSEPLIAPSMISPDHQNIAYGLVTRFYSEFKNADYILWGVTPESGEATATMALTRARYEGTFKKTVTVLRDAEALTLEQLRQCPAPCWLLVNSAQAHELRANPFIDQKLRPLGRPFFTLTWVPFTGQELVPEACENLKRLTTTECLIPLAIRESKRKMKKPNELYFFARRYNEKDYFLFVQQPH